MVEGDRQTFYKLVGDVYAFYRVDCTKFAYGVWWEACKGFDFEAVADAFNRHAVSADQGQFLPKPADVVKLLAGTSLDAAQIAWSKVDRAVRQVGTYQSVVFDDPLIHHVIADMGGWVHIGTKDEEAWPYIAKEFQTRYRAFRTSGVRSDPPKLIGVFEHENARQGYRPEPPVLLGDPAKAARVMGLLSAAPRVEITRLANVIPQIAAPKSEEMA